MRARHYFLAALAACCLQTPGRSGTNGPIYFADFSYVIDSSLNITGWGAQVAGNPGLTNGPGNPSAPVDFGQVITANYVWAGTNEVYLAPAGGMVDSTAYIAGLVDAAATVSAACGEFHTLLLKRDGSVAARGWNGVGQTSVPADLTNAVAIGCGADHSLAVRSDGRIVAWGWNGFGQSSPPDSATNIVAITGGARHSMALRADGQVLCWGGNESGQCNVPDAATNAIAIAAGGFHSLALLPDSTVIGWGSDSKGQIDIPAGLTNVVAVAGGAEFSLALLGNGKVVGWGDTSRDQATPPTDLAGVQAISAGDYHAAALKRDGTVVAWGDNTYQSTDVPPGLTNVVAIVSGGYHNESIVQTLPYLSRPRYTTNGLETDLNMVLGDKYGLDTSTDLKRWSALSNGKAIPGQMHFVFPATNQVQFYRARKRE
jgi:hypothetical protein